MKDVELKNNAMAFQLKTGDVLLISNDDVISIANRLVMEMMVNNQTKVFIEKSTAVEKCNLLYKIVSEQQDKMNDDVRQQYFKAIHELMHSDETKTITLEEANREAKIKKG